MGYGVIHLRHLFSNGTLRPFLELQNMFHLPCSMQFYYLQLRHAVKTQQGVNLWVQSSTPIFNYINEVTKYKGFILQCYSMLLNSFLRDHPISALSRWERDMDAFEEEQWEEALLAV